MRIIIIRHGEGYHNIGKIKKKYLCFGKLVSDSWNILYPKLTPNGFHQCSHTKIVLDSYSEHIDTIYVSPLSRTLQTASAIFNKRKLIAIPDVRENVKNPCDFREDKETLQKNFQNTDFTYVNDTADYNKFESDHDISLRCDKFYSRLVNDAKSNKFNTVAVVTHGAFINSFLSIYGKKINIENVTWFNNCEFRIGNIEY